MWCVKGVHLIIAILLVYGVYAEQMLAIQLIAILGYFTDNTLNDLLWVLIYVLLTKIAQYA